MFIFVLRYQKFNNVLEAGLKLGDDEWENSSNTN